MQLHTDMEHQLLNFFFSHLREIYEKCNNSNKLDYFNQLDP